MGMVVEKEKKTGGQDIFENGGQLKEKTSPTTLREWRSKPVGGQCF